MQRGCGFYLFCVSYQASNGQEWHKISVALLRIQMVILPVL